MSFNLESFFNSDSAISQVLFGEKRPVMETELNEMQEIQDHLRRELIRTLFSDGLIAPFNLSYTSGVLRIWDTKAIINGEIIYISDLSASLANGINLYLEVWREEVGFTHTLKKYGNEQETTIENKMIDRRIGYETSRRIQTKYQFSTSNTPVVGHTFFHLGVVTNGNFIQSAVIQSKIKLANDTVVANKYQTVVQTANQKIFNLTSHFNQNTDTITDLAQNGWLLSPSNYTLQNGILTLNEGVKVGTVISYTVFSNIATKSINY